MNRSGRWGNSTELGFSGTHVAVLRKPGTDSTTVFLFGESGTNQTMRIWRLLPSDQSLQLPTPATMLTLPHPNAKMSDLFCSGHATLPDGKLLLVGGAWVPDTICQNVYTLDPAWNGPSGSPWTQSATMAVERWYATATTMADGRILATAGTMSSNMCGFGGRVMGNAGLDSTWRVLQPLEMAGRFAWSETTAVPGNNPPPAPPTRVVNDWRTAGEYPLSRDGHAFLGDPSGRGVLLYGRYRKPGPVDSLLSDAWLKDGSIAGDDTTSIWTRFEQVGDSSLQGAPMPAPRYRFAATWAGLERTADGMQAGADDSIVCYLHGGIDVNGNVLGDLWRGKKQRALNPFDQWIWQRLLPDSPQTRRAGHSMVFDPGPPGQGAAFAQLLIYGGRTSPAPSYADVAKIYAFGVGSAAQVKGVWRELSPTLPSYGGGPTASEGQALVAKLETRGSERQFLMFGGEDAAGTLVPADLWNLERPDAALRDTNRYSWEKLPSAPGGPTPRTEIAMAYGVDSELLTVVGGDSNGTSTPNGYSNQVWVVNVGIYGASIQWRQPPMRSFHPGPPPIAGMKMLAVGAGGGRITRTLEAFSSASGSPAAGGCPAVPGQWQVVTDRVSDSERKLADYPYMFQLPDGRMFNAGPAPGSDLTTNGGNLYRRFYNLSTKQWVDGDPAGVQDPILFGSAVMYRPGKLLRAGSFSGSDPSSNASDKTETISIASGGTPAWVPYNPSDPNRRLIPRKNHNLTLLPTGDILVTGGHRQPDWRASVKDPQLWSVATGTWNSTFFNDAEQLAPDPRIRNYHSTAILLPDARVMTAGGEELANLDQSSASIYEPGYLFRSDNSYASRPHVQLAPPALTYGRTFTLTLTEPSRAATINSIALMRPSAATHSFDQNQHYVPLAFAVAQSPLRLLVQAPANAYLAAPGDHMLFVVDNLATDAPAVPSVAYWTKAGAAVTQVDPADVTPPRGGSYLALSDMSICPNLNADLTVGWTAPADDDTTAYSGWATAYNLRYKLNSSSESNFNAWTSVPTGTPGPLGASESAVLPGLSSALWYRFQIRAVGDNSDTSLISNALVAKPQYCEGDGGGGGFSLRPAGAGSYSVQPTGSTPQENSMFPGPLLGQSGRDALRLDRAPRLQAGSRLVFLREGGSRGLALDRARLVAVDHSAGTESAVTASGGFVSGVRVPAASVTDQVGRDLLAAASAAAPEPVYADSGEILSVTLPAAADSVQRLLLVEASAGGGLEPGIAVEVPSANGQATVLATINPRRYWSTHAIALAGASTVRLRFKGAYAVRFVGVLTQVNTAAATDALLLSASGGGVDLTTEVRELDGREAVITARDTLTMSFADVPPGTQAVRDWYLVVNGLPLTAQVAAFRAGRAHDAPRQPPLAFALHQNVPNPFRRATLIPFDLPLPGEARLEVFDAQGRRVWTHTESYGAGRQTIEWALRDARGRTVPPGIYSCRLTAGAQVAVRKMVVIP